MARWHTRCKYIKIFASFFWFGGEKKRHSQFNRFLPSSLVSSLSLSLSLVFDSFLFGMVISLRIENKYKKERLVKVEPEEEEEEGFLSLPFFPLTACFLRARVHRIIYIPQNFCPFFLHSSFTTFEFIWDKYKM